MVPGLMEASKTPRKVRAAARPAKLLVAAWHIRMMPQRITCGNVIHGYRGQVREMFTVADMNLATGNLCRSRFVGSV